MTKNLVGEDKRKPRNEERVDSNEKFEAYYRAQLLMNDTDFDLFLDYLKRPLPVSYRLTGSRNYAIELRDYMKSVLFPKLANLTIDGCLVNAPTAIPWYPNELGFVYDTGRTALRRCPAIKEFHQFLVAETEIGNISRQEVVSMIPPLMMDIKPGHFVLDMCAAPGSKTAQLLEAIVADSTGYPDGLVIANDSDQKRAYMLVHQTKRLQNPCLIVTNHEAQIFPRLIVEQDDGSSKSIQFDRILCDVPCSGDGTIRKNVTIWKTWNPLNAVGLHKIQLKILTRGCELLKVGGRLVYSTCSFNPIENEAVVAAMIKLGNGSIKIVDVSNEHPNLERRPGLSKWKVESKLKGTMDIFEEGAGLVETMFPPELAEDMGLEKCIRIYPFLQNTGGFFVAVLEKVDTFGTVDSKNEKLAAYKKRKVESEIELQEKVGEPPVKAKKPNGWYGDKEKPVVFLKENSELIEECCKSFGIGPSYPRDLFVIRAQETEAFRHIYAVSRKAKLVLTAQNASALKLVNTGVKLMTRNGGRDAATTPFRVSNEGITTLAPYFSKDRQVYISNDDLAILINTEYPKFTNLSTAGCETFKNLAFGYYLITFDPSKEPSYCGSISTIVLVPLLRANVSLSLLLDKAERKSLLSRLTGQELGRLEGVDSK